MRQVISGAAIALVSMAVFGFIVTPTLLRQGAEGVRTISVSGHAEKKLVPDEAHLQVNLNSMKPKMTEAKASHDEKLRALLALTKDAGVEDKKVRTESSNVQPIYEYVTDPVTKENPQPQSRQVFRGYRVQTVLDVTLVDTTKLGALMEKITDAGFEKDAKTEWGTLLTLSYQVSEPEKKREALLAEAIASARVKAETMASAAGTSIAGVHRITEGGVSSYMPPPMMAVAKAMSPDMLEGAVAPAPVAPPSGEQNLQANVSVVFELK